MALQVLTIFFIGGASGSSKLFNCQRFDGGRVELTVIGFATTPYHLHQLGAKQRTFGKNQVL